MEGKGGGEHPAQAKVKKERKQNPGGAKMGQNARENAKAESKMRREKQRHGLRNR